jgi:D-alanyl-lipoteichoic acid acyltransferase DltB (MBOAT superfamily)
MVVNSWAFLLFFSVVFVGYYLPVARSNPRFQNIWLLVSSYFFYGYVDMKMIALLLGSTVVFYLLGLGIRRQLQGERFRQAALLRTLGVVIGVGILFYFKYLNFFADSVAHLLQSLGMQATWTTLHIVMPVGVSFFTFKLISYVVEVCRERIEAERDFVNFANYVSFFPTILSGPIDCPKCLLGQLKTRRTIDSDRAIDGLRQIIWGILKKKVVADWLAWIIDSAWANVDGQSGVMLLVCALIYPVQMYMDFSGYSDMAIGVAKILNIRVQKNFNYPFFVTNIAEYWRKWHISLTGWLTEFVFMPVNVALRNWGRWGVIVAIMTNLLLVGMWHGANWTFVVFGLYHGLLFIPLILTGAFQKKQKRDFKGYIPSVGFVAKMLVTYLLVAFGLIIFRAPDVAEVGHYLSAMCMAPWGVFQTETSKASFLFGAIIMLLEWIAFVKGKQEYAVQTTDYGWKSYCVDLVMLVTLIFFMYNRSEVGFVYMQF